MAIDGGITAVSPRSQTVGVARVAPELESQRGGERERDPQDRAQQEHDAFLGEDRVVGIRDARHVDDPHALLAQHVLELGLLELFQQCEVDRLEHGSVAYETPVLHCRFRHRSQCIDQGGDSAGGGRELLIETLEILRSSLIQLPLDFGDAIGELLVLGVRFSAAHAQRRPLVLEVAERL